MSLSLFISGSDVRKALRGMKGVKIIIGEADEVYTNGKNIVPYRVENHTTGADGKITIDILMDSKAIETITDDDKKIYMVFKNYESYYLGESDTNKILNFKKLLN